MNTDPAIPAPELVFPLVEDSYGTRLAWVFGNEATGGVCPFYAKQCHHCDIGAGEGIQFNPELNGRRLKYFLGYYQAALPDVVHLVVYNSGSTLNPREFSAASLEAILEVAAGLPRCQVVSLDSREIYITPGHLGRVLRHLRPDQQARVILGLETQDDRLRQEILNKRMTRESIVRAFETVGRFCGRVGFDLNVVFAPPYLLGPDAIAEAVATVRYGLDLGHRFQAPVDFNFHPYYPSRMGLQRFPGHTRADLGTALEAVAQIQPLLRHDGGASRLFIGLEDESHDQQPSERHAELARFAEIFRHFNSTQRLQI
ncbi:MAG TPA: hypothetical protein VMF06_14290 [Candidatus Limnocylindria bacterium]|nr:hypothetical protein [Candidatus Limnocylindria bacterium]